MLLVILLFLSTASISNASETVKIVQVALGSNHSVALDQSGNVLAWGNNEYGQLGNGTTVKSETPVQVLFSKPKSNTDTFDTVKLSFKDLSTDHWASANIHWAFEHNIISGYDDKTVRPNNMVTEAEFLAFLQRAFPNSAPVVETSSSSIWYEKYYEFADSLNLPVDKSTATKSINRGRVAQIVVSGLGFNYDVEQSVNYLLNNGLAQGKTSSTYEGYEPFSNLTRAEAVTFIKNIVDKGITELERRPNTSSITSNAGFRTYSNHRFGFAIDFPNNWPKETLSPNGDGANIEGPHNGESGEFSAPEYSLIISASHYFEDFVNEYYPWALNPNGHYGYDDIETIELNNGGQAIARITGDGFPTVITAVIIQDDMMFKMEGTIGSVDSYDNIKGTLYNVMRTFRILDSGEERNSTVNEPLNTQMIQAGNYTVYFKDNMTDSRPFLKDELLERLLRLTYNPNTTIVISETDMISSMYNFSTMYDGKLSLLYMNNAIMYDVENLFKPYYQGTLSSDEAMKFDESPNLNVPKYTLDMGSYAATEEQIAQAAFSDSNDTKAITGLSFIELRQQVYETFYDDVLAMRTDSTQIFDLLSALEKAYYQFFEMEELIEGPINVLDQAPQSNEDKSHSAPQEAGSIPIQPSKEELLRAWDALDDRNFAFKSVELNEAVNDGLYTATPFADYVDSVRHGYNTREKMIMMGKMWHDEWKKQKAIIEKYKGSEPDAYALIPLIDDIYAKAFKILDKETSKVTDDEWQDLIDASSQARYHGIYIIVKQRSTMSEMPEGSGKPQEWKSTPGQVTPRI